MIWRFSRFLRLALPSLLAPRAFAAIGALLSFVVTAGVLYVVALDDWANQSGHIDSVARFYETAHLDGDLVDEVTLHRPTSFLVITATTLALNGANRAEMCVQRLSAPDGPLGEGARLEMTQRAINRACYQKVLTIGRFGGSQSLVALSPVIAERDHALAGIRVLVVRPTDRPTIAGALTDYRALWLLGVVTVASGLVGLLLGLALRGVLNSLRENIAVDPLTGCLRRDAFMAAAGNLVRASHAAGWTGAVLVFNVDGLEDINEHHGQLAGDLALRLTARALHAALRRGDLLGRIGGDEFAVVLPDTREDVARTFAERVRAAVARSRAHMRREEQVALSVSVAVIVPDVDETADGAIARGRRALHQARPSNNIVLP